MDQVQQLRPHVLIFPFPAQGHVNSMLKLAELLCLAGINITFLVSNNIHNRLLRHTNVVSRFSKYPGFHLDHYPDAYDESKVHIAQEIMDLCTALQSVVKPFLKELLSKDPAHGTRKDRPPFSCIIVDGFLSLALDVAEEIGLPLICFRTISAGAFWTYFCIPRLVEAGELPFPGDEMNLPIENVKGMEGFLRRCDLPSFLRVGDLTNPDFNLLLKEALQTPRAKGLILNTFEDLEGCILSHFRTHCRNLYTIGPLHAHLRARLQLQEANSNNSNSNSLWEEDKSCIKWLDNQPPKSVLYVSFGSIAIITRETLLEFWHGIVNSGVRFLWVIRPNSVNVGLGDDVLDSTKSKSKSTPEMELEEATKERGCMVGWAPQEDVLAHPAIGGFLTHSGWNSTLESIAEGVPMICWPCFADQQPNSRFVGEIWKIGLDMKDTCDRVIVEKMVRDLMVERKDEFLHRADEMAKLARKSIEEGGSSFCNLVRLIDDIVKG
ncbi:7-deoxyloganetic acid glucosyltransferase-like [Coffea arabica]|uniref:Glycosyltransferase n=1 Tax=Coffea arabica TaxID=13443 RepID=A0A6P6U5L0_COFAR